MDLDIDECAYNSTCSEGLTCVNSFGIGSYFCIGSILELEEPQVNLDWLGGDSITATIMLRPNTSFEGFDLTIEDTYVLKSPLYGSSTGSGPDDRVYVPENLFYNYTKDTGELIISFTSVQGITIS